MELWDVYDVNRTKTGQTMVRGEAFGPEVYHLVIHVCVFNSKNEMLIQQRQPFKEGWPNYWDITVGGSSVAGETSQMAAQRELQEEVGIQWDFSQTRPHLTIHYSRGFDDVYLIHTDVDIESLSLQYEEVQAVKWASKEEIKQMIQDTSFIPYFPSLIDLLFDMRKHYRGGHSL